MQKAILVLWALTVSAAATAAPLQDEDTDQGPSYASVDGIAQGDLLNVRATASPMGIVLGRLENGSVLKMFECKPVNGYDWCRVEAANDASIKGWSPARYLLASGGAPASAAQPAIVSVPVLPPVTPDTAELAVLTDVSDEVPPLDPSADGRFDLSSAELAAAAQTLTLAVDTQPTEASPLSMPRPAVMMQPAAAPTMPSLMGSRQNGRGDDPAAGAAATDQPDAAAPASAGSDPVEERTALLAAAPLRTTMILPKPFELTAAPGLVKKSAVQEPSAPPAGRIKPSLLIIAFCGVPLAMLASMAAIALVSGISLRPLLDVEAVRS
jgi:hypothetical protein